VKAGQGGWFTWTGSTSFSPPFPLSGVWGCLAGEASFPKSPLFLARRLAGGGITRAGAVAARRGGAGALGLRVGKTEKAGRSRRRLRVPVVLVAAAAARPRRRTAAGRRRAREWPKLVLFFDWHQGKAVGWRLRRPKATAESAPRQSSRRSYGGGAVTRVMTKGWILAQLGSRLGVSRRDGAHRPLPG
jgi:hypothetical protein